MGQFPHGDMSVRDGNRQHPMYNWEHFQYTRVSSSHVKRDMFLSHRTFAMMEFDFSEQLDAGCNVLEIFQCYAGDLDGNDGLRYI